MAPGAWSGTRRVTRAARFAGVSITIIKMSPPSLLYKYVTPAGIDILRSCRLKISSPLNFNDPFEFDPPFTRPTGAYLPPAMGLAPDQTQRFMELWQANWDENDEAFFREVARRSAADCGVISLAEEDVNPLMWAHYTEQHQGLCIGFAFSEMPVPLEIRQIMYQQMRPSLNTDLIIGGKASHEEGERIVFSKSHHWAYEKEWRIFFGSIAGKAAEYLTLCSAVVRTVALGLRCSPELEKEVREILSDKQFAHTTIVRAQMHPTKFELLLK